MMRGIVFGAVAALALGACSPTPPSCDEPIPPKTVDGSTATETEMVAAHDTVQQFIKDSDAYQVCLVSALKEHEKNPPLLSRFVDDGFRADIDRRLRANQTVKEKVGNGFNEAAHTYNRLHP